LTCFICPSKAEAFPIVVPREIAAAFHDVEGLELLFHACASLEAQHGQFTATFVDTRLASTVKQAYRAWHILWHAIACFEILSGINAPPAFRVGCAGFSESLVHFHFVTTSERDIAFLNEGLRGF
tara:strand:+ start:9401 stop:9775 length:375 start_codon:yes stop_codon:yes gene_type:complete